MLIECICLFHSLSFCCGRFRKIAKSTVSFVMSALPSVRPSIFPFSCPQGTTLIPQDRFSWFLIFSILWKCVAKIQVSLKSHKNKGCFTVRPMYNSDTSCSVLLTMRKMFQTILVEEIKTIILYSIYFLRNFCVYKITRSTCVENIRPRMIIWRMRIACWVPKAKITPSECVILYCFSTATAVVWTWFGVTLYVHCACCLVSCEYVGGIWCDATTALLPF